MTLRYAHLSPDVKREAVKRLNGRPDGQVRGAVGEQQAPKKGENPLTDPGVIGAGKGI